MKPNELSDLYLALAIADEEVVIIQAQKAKRELLDELANRREVLREKFRRSEFKMEREAE